MCGFSGIVKLNNSEITSEEINLHQVISKELSHRGPDYSGFLKSNWYTISHNRLSIIDVDQSANQPFQLNDRFILLFNGEIYNHRELRKELKGKYSFTTSHSDTEVLYFMWMEYQEKMFTKLRGFYSFVIIDLDKKSVCLYRDKSGKKPLFYTVSKDTLIFASESSAIISAFPREKYPVSRDSVSHFLTYLAPPSGKSMFEGISKVMPSELLTINNCSRVDSVIGDSLIKNTSFKIIGIPRYNFFNQFKKIYQDALRERMDVDVDLWFALSGGVDSSLNAIVGSDLAGDRSINTVTLANRTSKFSEHVNAKKIATDTESNHIEIDVNERLFSLHADEYLSSNLDSPAGDLAGVLMYILCKNVAGYDGKVLIVGEGGDELGGYRSYWKELKLLLLKRSGLLQIIPKLRKYVTEDRNLLPLRNQHGFSHEEKLDLVTFDFRDSRDIQLENLKLLEKNLSRHFKNLMANEYLFRIPEVIHTRIDLPSMRSGVEVRAPFLDERLIAHFGNESFVFKALPRIKYHLKRYLKQMKKYDFILNTQKVGLGMLTDTYIRAVANENLESWCQSENHELFDFVRSDEVLRMIKSNKDRRYDYKLWILYSLGKWLERL